MKRGKKKRNDHEHDLVHWTNVSSDSQTEIVFIQGNNLSQDTFKSIIKAPQN